MYETHFNLRERPFATVPRVEHYYPAASAETARTTLLRTLERAEGIAMLIGAAGSGKTLLCQKLAQSLRPRLPVVTLAAGRLTTRRALLQAILHDLAQPYRGLEEGEMRLALVDYLAAGEDCPAGMVLVMDEAHGLPRRVLDEIGTLANLERDGQPQVRLLLAGNRLLEEHLTDPRLESLNQRVVARCYLQSLNRSETQDYLHARIAAAGGQGSRIFPAEACQSIYKTTDGVPRLINQLGEHVLLQACAAGRRQVTRADVEAAWADLQQLPAPAGNEPAAEHSNVIEFGRLEDEPADDDDGAPLTPPEPTADEVSPALHISAERLDDEREPLPVHAQVQHVRRLLADVAVEFGPGGPLKNGAAVSPGSDRTYTGKNTAEQASMSTQVPETQVARQPVLVEDDTAPTRSKTYGGGSRAVEHPFSEKFDDEELVVDRHGARRAEVSPSPFGQRSPSGPLQKGPPIFEIPLASGDEGETPTVPMHRDKLLAEMTPDDQDMVIVEHGYEDPPPWQTRKVVPVPRHEYSRLFAKLRYK